jgi:SagB-type dehydrogenase family enzyme
MSKQGIITIIGLAILSTSMIAASENGGGLRDFASKAIKLQEPRTEGGIAVAKALLERRSIRAYGSAGLSIDEVSQLLWAAQGITDDKGHRTAPSAMESYPLHVYLLAKNVTGLPAGVYRYSPQGHNLTVIAQGRIDEYYDAAAGTESWIKTAPAIFVITGALDALNRIPGIQPVVNQASKNKRSPEQDFSRWVYVEAGAAAENLLLEVVSMDLASTYTAGFDATRTEELLGLPKDEVPIGVLPVGRKAET